MYGRRRRSWSREIRWIGSLVVGLVVLGCGAGDASGGASIWFDGFVVGDGFGSDSHPRISCRRDPETGDASLIQRRDRSCCGIGVAGDWAIPGRADDPGVGEPGDAFVGRILPIDLRLELTPDAERPAAVRFRIGSSVYASDDETVILVEPGWDSGATIFRRVPQVEGDTFRGMTALGELRISWACG